MTKIKLCGLSRPEDIQAANELAPDYIGFVFSKNSRRYVTPLQAAQLRAALDPAITVVGVFVNEALETIAALAECGIIDAVQLHGSEDENDIAALRELTDLPLIQAFRIEAERDIAAAQRSTADHVLLDSGRGTGTAFDWSLISQLKRPYFLAGGLRIDNVRDAVASLNPFAVDVSSGIETGGVKDPQKMTEFVHAVRSANGKED